MLTNRVNKKVRMLLSEINKTAADLADVFDFTTGDEKKKRIYASARFNANGIKTVHDLVKVVDYCGGAVIIKTPSGVDIPITVEDVEEDRKTRPSKKKAVK